MGSAHGVMGPLAVAGTVGMPWAAWGEPAASRKAPEKNM